MNIGFVNIGFVNIGFVDPRCEHRVCEPYNLWILDVNIGFVKSAVDQPQQPQQPPAARAARAASAIGVFKYCQSVFFA